MEEKKLPDSFGTLVTAGVVFHCDLSAFLQVKDYVQSLQGARMIHFKISSRKLYLSEKEGRNLHY